MWHLFWFKRDEFLRHYHRRSNVESTFSAIKRKFGPALRSKHFSSQVNELLAKVLAHNIVVLIHEMYALGIDPLAFWRRTRARTSCSEGGRSDAADGLDGRAAKGRALCGQRARDACRVNEKVHGLPLEVQLLGVRALNRQR